MEKIGQQEQAGKGKEPGASSSPHLSCWAVRLAATDCRLPLVPPAEVVREPPPGFNPKVVEVYTKCVRLSRPARVIAC